MEELYESTVDAEAAGPVVEDQVAGTPEGEGGAGEEAPQAEQQEAAEPARQTKEQNAAFAAARREAEARAREIEAQNRRLLDALGQFGIRGQNPEEVADQLEAQARNMTVQQLQAERQAQKEQLRKAMEADPEYQSLRAQKEALEQKDMERVFADDLAAIRKANPQENAKGVEELGETFLKARAMGMDALTAYDLVQREKARSIKPKPPIAGAVNAATGANKEYYTPEEVDAIPPEAYDKDPGLWERVRKSMYKWK